MRNVLSFQFIRFLLVGGLNTSFSFSGNLASMNLLSKRSCGAFALTIYWSRYGGYRPRGSGRFNFANTYLARIRPSREIHD